jgi:hypothetical protein
MQTPNSSDMTPHQIAQAVSCYVAMRRVVIAATGGPNPELGVSLKDTRKWSPTRVWQQIWWLFFYSGMKTAFAHPRALAARKAGWFDSFAVFAAANSQRKHAWHVQQHRTHKGGQTYTALGAEAKAFCAGTDAYSSMPYRTGARVVHRINRLAEFFTALTAAAEVSGRSVIHELAGGNALASNALDIAIDNLEPVTGPITAQHCLSALGFPCVKSDIWLCRIASWCGWTPGYSPEDLINNRRHGWLVLRTVCQTIAAASVSSGAVAEPNPLRAVDWYVANYGMLKSPTTCPCSALVARPQPTE